MCNNKYALKCYFNNKDKILVKKKNYYHNNKKSSVNKIRNEEVKNLMLKIKILQ